LHRRAKAGRDETASWAQKSTISWSIEGIYTGVSYCYSCEHQEIRENDLSANWACIYMRMKKGGKKWKRKRGKTK